MVSVVSLVRRFKVHRPVETNNDKGNSFGSIEEKSSLRDPYSGYFVVFCLCLMYDHKEADGSALVISVMQESR